MKRTIYHSLWDIVHLDLFGHVLFKEQRKNSLTDEGEKYILEKTFLANDPTIVQESLLYVRFCNQAAALDAGSTLLNIEGEPAAGNGYDPTSASYPGKLSRDFNGFPTLLVPPSSGNNWLLKSKEVAIAATPGSVGPLNTMFLSTSFNNSGLLIAFVSLSTTRTIQVGDTMRAQFGVQLLP